jgi:hypothetical protein
MHALDMQNCDVVVAASPPRARGALCCRRIAFALLFTPLLAPFYAAILSARPWLLPIGLLLSYPTAVLIGAPTVFLLARKIKVEWWHCVALGMLCSMPAIIAYACAILPPDVDAYSTANAVIVIAWGAFSGLCFWLLGVAGDSPVTLRTIMAARLVD